MELLLPKLGLFLWTIIIFLIFFFLLKKFAWKPIMKGIHDRESSIENSLAEANKAREEMKNLTSENEALLKEARIEREKILKEARLVREDILAKARIEADEESTRMIGKAREEIESEKMAAIIEIKNQVGKLSLEIAEKLLRKKLADPKEGEALVKEMVAELHLN